MRKLGWVAAFLAVFIFGAAVGAGMSYHHSYRSYMGLEADTAAGHLLTDLAVARHLRLGEPETAMRSLDEKIDGEIVFVAQPPPGIPQTALARRALTAAKTYRERFPSGSPHAAQVALALQGIQVEPREAHLGMLTKVGDAAPAFAVKTINGTRFDLARARGKVVVLNLFSPTCGACLQELPHLEREIWAKYKGREIAMVAIARDCTPEEIRAIPQAEALSFLIATDPDRAVFRKYAEQYVPQTYVIDPAGKIAYQCTGFYPGDTAEMAKVIENLLRE